MPITMLDPKTALVVIDLQRGIVGQPVQPDPAGVVAKAAQLAAAFRAARLPVVLVHVKFAADRSDMLKTRVDAAPPATMPSADFSEYVDALDVAPSDIQVIKRQWGAFYGTDLDLQLRRRGVTGIVLCGISTSIGVESTARSAWEHGYNIAFAIDAMGDMRPEAHQNSIERIFPRLGEVGTTADVLAKLADIVG
ncbi:MAG: hydrolase [Vulcanimicrobiaceae bacterium]